VNGVRPVWPDGKSFAFTIFDDPDSQTLEIARDVYGFLRDLGFRTTKGIWPIAPPRHPSDHGATCGDPAYASFARELQQAGFEIGLHNATCHTSLREETAAGLAAFERLFGAPPRSYAQHYFCDENLYWGDRRVSGINRAIYNLVTRNRYRDRFHGDTEGHPLFWGDLCRARIRYVRSFAFADVNTLNTCPVLPYHDPERPFVNYWFTASEGSNLGHFTATLTEANQERLEAEGGACIMYTHFGHGFHHGQLDARFRTLMTRLASRNGWFVPVSTLLDHLAQSETPAQRTITPAQRRRLERRWLIHKMRYGSA